MTNGDRCESVELDRDFAGDFVLDLTSASVRSAGVKASFPDAEIISFL